MYGRSTVPLRSSDTSSPSSAVATDVTDGVGPTTSRCMMAAFVALAVTSS